MKLFFDKLKEQDLFYWIFFAYSFFILGIFFFLIFILKFNPFVFLSDDGYYLISKDFYNQGFGSLFHQFRPPLFPLLLSLLNFFPEFIQPFIRIIITLVFVFLNVSLIRRFLRGQLSTYSFNMGMILALFNPLHVHWTLKSTPEIYVLFFLCIIVVFLTKLYIYGKCKYLIYLILCTFVATNFKPVFSLISLVFFILILVHKHRKVYTAGFIFLLLSIIGQLITMQYSKPLENKVNVQYGKADLIANYFIIPAMIETKSFSFGSQQELMLNNPEKSVLAVADGKYKEWIERFNKEHSESSLFYTLVSFVLQNPGKVIITKLCSPILFISLASTVYESVSNLIINGLIFLFSFIGLSRLNFVNNRNLILFICVLLGYYLTYFIAFSYARYSVPVIFCLSYFVFIEKVKIHETNG